MTPKQFLNHGLQKGFTGDTVFAATQRAGFALQTNHLVEGENIYQDEWLGDRTSAGQELVLVGGQKCTRVYAGGMISIEALGNLKITKKDVMEYLFRCLKEFGSETRLDADIGPKNHGEWSYLYRVLEKNDAIPMTTGKEEISYRGQVVFVHVFVICPVE